MKCILIVPAWRPEEIFSGRTAGSQINYWQPLGTLSVAASLIQVGHQVEFLDGGFLDHEQIVERTQSAHPDFVGLYATVFGWPRACSTAADIRKKLPNVFIAAGGPYPTAAPEECLEGAPMMDAVVCGEGEVTAVALLERLRQGRELEGLRGVAFRRAEQVLMNPPRPLIQDLDRLPPPARKLLDGADRYIPPPATYRRKPVAVLMTSRGCNRKCIFCYQMDRSRNSGIRYRSVDSVLAEIRACLRQGYREIKFIDDTLAADYDRAMELARRIREERLDFTWFASACANQVDRPLLEAFREAGCWAVLIGAESGVQKNLNTLRKGITLEQIGHAVGAAKAAGLKVFTPFLFGIPGETFEEGLQTIEFACELDPDVANFHCLTPFPGTELYDRAAAYGTVSEDFGDYTYQGAAFTPHSMSREEIQRLRQLAFRRFYSRPRFLARRLLGMRSLHDCRTAVQGVRSLFSLWTERDLFRRGANLRN
jgi:radical SAM superfamily enzyme YgiQ (UPF0313 family)